MLLMTQWWNWTRQELWAPDQMPTLEELSKPTGMPASEIKIELTK